MKNKYIRVKIKKKTIMVIINIYIQTFYVN